MFEPAAGPVMTNYGPVKSARKFPVVVSFVSALTARTSASAMSSFELVGDRRLCTSFVLNQYVTVECNQSIFMIKTRNYTFLS